MLIFMATAVNAEMASSNQKQKAVAKKKPLKIQPGDVYPGDAAAAGYKEIRVGIDGDPRKYQIKDEIGGVYLFSDVEFAGEPWGYFRVVQSSSTLVFAALVPPPLDEKGVTPIKAVKGLIVLYQQFWTTDYRLSVLNGSSFVSIIVGNKPPVFEDIDHDGRFETFVHKYLPRKGTDRLIEGAAVYPSIEGTILSVYKYISY